ncbi:Phosphatidate phosphatase APP1 [Golovinomyces cichoracearum]|uniref:Phosphatidate phosphatase APP1 n=1 Tax=Golovinomyces cichoracearum TaxID=62708 RepID=A0A420HN15_9PEZI|nr:Phosphatidate phosphatase APP1 [Golovinomyces cichoracearum]
MEIKSDFRFLKNLLVNIWRRLINPKALMNTKSILKLPLQREILGPCHSFQGYITGNETVWLFDNTAYQSAEGNWMAEFVVVVFSQDIPLGMASIFLDIAQKKGLADTSESIAIIQDRLSSWLRDVLPGRVVKINFGHQNHLSTSPGGASGISCDLYNLPDFGNGTIISSKANVPFGTDGLLEMKTLYAGPEGWGLVSDIDDTIKVTQTDHPLGFMIETFIATATPIEGMPKLYADIAKLITPFSPFFYVSSSPYNLYPFLSKFCQEHYPQGTIMLSDLSWKNMKDLFSYHIFGPQAFKIDRIKKIHSWFPRRKMICIGDSTQSDPEIYGEL